MLTIRDKKMSNVARYLACAYAVLLMQPLLPMQMLLWQLMRLDTCDDVMLQCVCMCLCVSTARVCMCFMYVSLCVRAFAVRE